MSENVILSKTINELVEAPGVISGTYFPSQREGATRAEKVSIGSVGSFILNSAAAEAKIKALGSKQISTGLEEHRNQNDPHGDRAYTDSLLNEHLVQTDPHGSKLYTDTALVNHNRSNDPHGDRQYTREAILAHSSEDDPHGNKAFTLELYDQHISEDDPHGSKKQASLLMEQHVKQVDPHGDRAYTNNELFKHNSDADAHGILTKILAELRKHNEQDDAHNLNSKFNHITNQISSAINNAFLQRAGTMYPVLDQGKIPEEYIPTKVIIKEFSSFPVLGESGVLYVDSLYKALYLWIGTSYVQLNSGMETNSLSTDDIPQGNSPSRRYFTKELEDLLNSKIGSVSIREVGESLIDLVDLQSNKLTFKSLVGVGSISVSNLDTHLEIGDNTYKYEAYHDDDVVLTSREQVLKGLSTNEVVTIIGNITALNYKEAGDMRAVKSFDSWDVNATFGITAEMTPITPPNTFVLASNGMVLTCKAPVSTQVEIYTSGNALLGVGTTLTDGACTITLNSAKLSGELLKAYTVDQNGLRSEPSFFYANNTTTLKDLNTISISPTGLIFRGNTSRLADIEILDSSNVLLGKGKADTYGNFSITMNKAVTTGDIITVRITLGATLSQSVSHTVALTNIVTPYDITYNREHTVIKGKAEPLSLIEISAGSKYYEASSDTTGSFTLYTFSEPLPSGEVILKSIQEDRLSSTVTLIEESAVILDGEPKVSQNVTRFTEGFLEKKITRLLGKDTTATLDLIFDPITRSINVKGSNKVKETLTWSGNLRITKYAQGNK